MLLSHCCTVWQCVEHEDISTVTWALTSKEWNLIGPNQMENVWSSEHRIFELNKNVFMRLDCLVTVVYCLLHYCHGRCVKIAPQFTFFSLMCKGPSHDKAVHCEYIDNGESWHCDNRMCFWTVSSETTRSCCTTTLLLEVYINTENKKEIRIVFVLYRTVKATKGGKSRRNYPLLLLSWTSEGLKVIRPTIT